MALSARFPGRRLGMLGNISAKPGRSGIVCGQAGLRDAGSTETTFYVLSVLMRTGRYQCPTWGGGYRHALAPASSRTHRLTPCGDSRGAWIGTSVR